MQKNITNIKDFITQAITNGSEIKVKAESGEALPCFHMGMIYMFGIDTPIDFLKATKYLSCQGLNDDPEADRLLGYISECDGDYSLAFKKYASAAECKDGEKKGYITKVFEERNYLIEYFKKIGLPDATDVFNKEISQILNDYIKGGHSKIDACIKLATICNDEPLFLEVAQNFFSIGDYYSAKKWLLKGNVDSGNHLYIYVKERLMEVEEAIKTSKELDVIDIDGDSLFEKGRVSSTPNINSICNITIKSSKQDWIKSVSSLIDSVKRILEEEERIRLQRIQEEAARQKIIQEEEEARQRKLVEEEGEREKELNQETDIVSHKKELEGGIVYKKKPSGKIFELGIENTGHLAALSINGMNNDTSSIENNLIKELMTTDYPDNHVTWVHMKFVINGQNGKACKIVLEFEPNGLGKPFEYSMSVTPNHDICEWIDFQTVIGSFYYSLKKDGRYSYKVSMSLFDSSNHLLDTKSINLTIDFVHHMLKEDEYIVVN